MSYAQFGTIQAADFNTLVGGNPTSTANTLNATWATGLSAGGYGQTAVANVTVGQTVASTAQWTALVANTASAATHQGTSITAVTAPAAGGVVTYVSAIPTNLTSIWTSRLNAASQGGTSANTVTYASTWSAALTFTHTATFANGDAARYFFNSGGQIKMTVSHPSGTGINLLFNNLASNVGTVVMSALNVSGTQTISGVSYNGITKVGGGGNAPTISATSGYYAQTTSNANVFTQLASTGPAGYLSTFIRFITKSNGTQGANGDTGSVITIYTVWDEVPDGLVVSAGSATTMTLVPPESTNIANTWGAVTLAGTASGA
jgi:hypothetical protein